MKKNNLIILLILLATFAVSVYYYPQMPEKVASHWGIDGNVDGYMPKFWGMFIAPLMSLFILAIFIAIPKIEPLRENLEKFKNYYDGFIVVMLSFFFYIQILVIFSNIGVNFNMTQAMIPALSVLFYYCGILVDNAKQNWFVGIRTPWTLSSENVWNKTHKLGAKLFKISSVVMLIGIVLPQYAFYLILAPILFSAFYSMFYSYLEYRKEMKKSKKKVKAQVAIEFMIIFGAFLISLTVISLASWNNIVDINKSNVDFDAHRILTLTSGRINTVYLSGDGFSMELAIPEKIGNYNYTLSIEQNNLWLYVNHLSYSKRLLTSNITGILDGGVSMISNIKGGIVIT